MLTTVLLSFVVIALAILAMGVGVLAGREPIRGSCGGLNGKRCDLCSASAREPCRQRTGN